MTFLRLKTTVLEALHRVAQDHRGNVAVTFGIGALPVMLAVGSGVDYARMVQAQSAMQTAVDAAVLAAAPYSTSNRPAVGSGYLAAQLPSQLTLTSSSFTTNADGSVTGTAQATMQTAVMAIAHVKTLTVGATAKAGYAPSTNSVCILIKDPSASQALLMNSGVTINAPKCEIDDASTGNPAAMFNSPSLNVSSVCVKGANATQNGSAVSGLKTSCATAADPFAGTLPTVSSTSCTVSNQNYSGTNTLSPGVYCGNFNFNGSGTLNLSPGLYVFSNTRWNVNSGWTVSGTGVTFYFADANSYIQINSGVAMNVSAPTSGTYANILMYEPTGLSTSSFSINGSAGHSFTGLIYLPSRNVTFNSMSSTTGESLTMVFNQMILNSGTNWSLAPGVKTIASAQSGSSGGTSSQAYLEQ